MLFSSVEEEVKWKLGRASCEGQITFSISEGPYLHCRV